MSETLSQQLNQFINKANWPQGMALTEQSRSAYEQGIDTLNMYRGHPQVLVDALKIFQSCGSLAYAAAGCAYTLMLAAYESGDSYSASGLEFSRDWLIKAQEAAPGHAEIDFIEAELYLHLGELENTRLVLDELTKTSPPHFYVCLSELYYWYTLKDQEHYQHWYEVALPQATNQFRKICLLSRAAGFFMAMEEWKKVIATYRDLAALDPQDAWMWHNLSLAYYHLERYDKAQQANQQALSIMDFPVAREMEQLLKSQLGS